WRRVVICAGAVPMVRPASLLLLALAAGCSDARYGDAESDDAGKQSTSGAEVRDGSLPDASLDAAPAVATPSLPDASATPPVTPATPDAAVPADWRTMLATHYAIAARFYAKDKGLGDAARYSHEIYMLARVLRDGETVRLEARRCIDRGSVLASPLKDEFWWPNAQAVEPQLWDLVMRPDGLRTQAAARPLGYRDQPGECTMPGKQLQVDGRPWLPGGRCDCRADALPMVANDCRIVDDDGDGKPGITVDHMGLLDEPESMRTLDGSQILNAQLSADGSMQGSFLQSYETLSLGCGNNPCTRAELAPCPLELNPVLLEPLADGEWDCAKMLAEQDAGKLFALPPLAFVNGC
ncbi:MAG: hypothetical protein ABW352_18115, partial [Polyangiales bacterium]